MLRILKYLVPASIFDRWKKLNERVENLERAVDVMIQSPRYAAADSAGLNGQLNRKRILTELLEAIPFKSVVETGTYTGDTSAYLAETSKLPVYTCEIAPRFHELARRRVPAEARIEFTLGDSETFLRRLIQRLPAGEAVFCYLDAHWYEDLPLAPELGLIAGHWKDYVVMIDDFQVPSDGGYGYDEGICLDLIQKVVKAGGMGVFFPAAPAAQETGAKRGWVLLSSSGEMTRKVAGIAGLIRRQEANTANA